MFDIDEEILLVEDIVEEAETNNLLASIINDRNDHLSTILAIETVRYQPIRDKNSLLREYVIKLP